MNFNMFDLARITDATENVHVASTRVTPNSEAGDQHLGY